MMLLLDIGNSRVKWAVAQGRTLAPTVAVKHTGDPATVIGALPVDDVGTVWIAQVMGKDHERKIAAAVQERFGVFPHFARSAAQVDGLEIAYADPSRLGIDRWLMLLAAWQQVRGACCVVSAGTALTLDAVDANGQHLGGFIAPGLTAMLQATLGTTRFATGDLAAEYTDGLGDSTESCVRQGAIIACLGAIEHGVQAAGTQGPRYICGGDAAVLLPRLRGNWTHRSDLVLQGLLALALQSA